MYDLYDIGDLYDHWYLRGLGASLLTSDNSSKADRDTWNKYKRMIMWMESKFLDNDVHVPIVGGQNSVVEVRNTSARICEAILFVLNDGEVKRALASTMDSDEPAIVVSGRVVDTLYIEACNKTFQKLFLTTDIRMSAYSTAIQCYFERLST